MHSTVAQPGIRKPFVLSNMAFRGACCWLAVAIVGAASNAAMAAGDAKPFLGNWALTLPTGGAGWLGVAEKDGQLQAALLWGGGSVLPVADVKIDGDQLVLKRARPAPKKAAPGKSPKTPPAEIITARVSGDTLNLTVGSEAAGAKKSEFTGKRTPPLPAAPELSKVKFGPPIVLFGGKDLSGWTLTNPNAASGWSVENGILINRPVQEEGKPHKSYTNLRTEKEFEDFNLKLETRVSAGNNSGIYLRGIYEIQVADTYGKPLDSHNMGGIYSRICPTVAAEKPAGEWQTFDITLVDRHVTVVLNGTKIIDNQPLLGCTGGALWSDQFRPGPLYLQGDHTGVEYRNIVLRPVVK
jgi:hypothetical protein